MHAKTIEMRMPMSDKPKDKPKDLPSITYWYEKKDGRVIFCYTFTEEQYEARNHPAEVVGTTVRRRSSS